MAARRDLAPPALLDLRGLRESGVKPVPRRRCEQIESVPHTSSLIASGSTNKRSLSRPETALRDLGVKLNAIGKYPFERFSDDAKQALVAAQKEAEISQRGYIGTEHILLGLLRIGSGSAYRALSKLAIDA
jgi:hypothetical protein